MTDSQPRMLANRLRRNERRLKPWRLQREISCYRVYDRDIPEIPLQVDRYGDALHVATMLRPDEEERAESTPWLEELLEAAADALGVAEGDLFLKHRRRQQGRDQYSRFGSQAATRVVAEDGLRFEVNLSDYLDTGLFLDHRRLRREVRAQAAGAAVLNLFAYTGSFSVFAAAGGARSTMSVDLSNTYLDWAGRNLALNRESIPLPEDAPEGTPPGDLAHHVLVRADVLRWLDDAPAEGWDMVIVDPPSFSNSKAMNDVLDIQRDHPALLSAAMRTLRPGGVLYFSTNRRGFRPDAGMGEFAAVEEITGRTVDLDFERHRPHRAWRLRHR
ncbi:MAG: hypothetical protein EA398_14280 [Deltaproteobacteria bacterium]|nr:MAG: hypothetical protein EA398_14280 [Deltaproteobacteria bacterium]